MNSTGNATVICNMGQGNPFHSSSSPFWANYILLFQKSKKNIFKIFKNCFQLINKFEKKIKAKILAQCVGFALLGDVLIRK